MSACRVATQCALFLLRPSDILPSLLQCRRLACDHLCFIPCGRTRYQHVELHLSVPQSWYGLQIFSHHYCSVGGLRATTHTFFVVAELESHISLTSMQGCVSVCLIHGMVFRYSVLVSAALA